MTFLLNSSQESSATATKNVFKSVSSNTTESTAMSGDVHATEAKHNFHKNNYKSLIQHAGRWAKSVVWFSPAKSGRALSWIFQGI